MGTTGDPPEPYISIEMHDESHLEVVKRLLELEGWKYHYYEPRRESRAVG